MLAEVDSVTTNLRWMRAGYFVSPSDRMSMGRGLLGDEY